MQDTWRLSTEWAAVMNPCLAPQVTIGPTVAKQAGGMVLNLNNESRSPKMADFGGSFSGPPIVTPGEMVLT